MRDSGLAHILSISGLHMAIVGGFVFFLVRLLVAAWPWLALRVAGQEGGGRRRAWPRSALSGALGRAAAGRAGGDHRRPSPSSPSCWTGRRSPCTPWRWRPWWSCCCSPRRSTQPGFQMSFAATAALVALAEAWPRPLARDQRALADPRWCSGAASGWSAACLASLVAGLATGPFAIQHFNRVAPVRPVRQPGDGAAVRLPDDAGPGARRGAGAARAGRAVPVAGGLGHRG